MIHYFYLLNRDWMQLELCPALTESFRHRSFAPCLDLCRKLLASKLAPDDAILGRMEGGLTYDRDRWHALVGELLVLGAEAMPRVPITLDALCCLLTPARLGADPAERAGYSSLEQVYYGTRDLRFGGGWYRPNHVGWNDAEDVERLLAYLRGVDSSTWSAAALTPLQELPDDAERLEELAYVRDWWPALMEMYAEAHRLRQVIVCERT
jgi:hypothetical protein